MPKQEKTVIQGEEKFFTLEGAKMLGHPIFANYKGRDEEDYKIAWLRWARNHKQEENGQYLCPACGGWWSDPDSLIIHWWETAVQHGGEIMIPESPNPWARITGPPSEIELERETGEITEEPAGDAALRRTMREYFDMYDADGGGTMNETSELVGTTVNLVNALGLKNFSKLEAS